MSYYAIFKPTKEVMEEYNVSSNKFGPDKNFKAKLNDDKLSLLLMILRPVTNEKDAFYPEKNIVFYVKTLLASIQYCVEQGEKQFAYDRWKDDDNSEMWYQGWQFCDNRCDKTVEEVTNRTIEDLMILNQIVPTPDYFDESEKFYDKYNRIREIINEFEDDIRDIAMHNIANELEPYKIGENLDGAVKDDDKGEEGDNED